MKFRKYLVYLLIFMFSIPALMTFSSCQPSYRNMRTFTKNNKTKAKRNKAYKNKRRFKQKSSKPINTEYVMKTKRRNRYHY